MPIGQKSVLCVGVPILPHQVHIGDKHCEANLKHRHLLYLSIFFLCAKWVELTSVDVVCMTTIATHMSKHDINKRMAEATSIVDVKIIARGGCRGMVVGTSQAPTTRGEGGRQYGGGSSSDGD